MAKNDDVHDCKDAGGRAKQDARAEDEPYVVVPCLHGISASLHVDGKERRCSVWPFSGVLPYKAFVHPVHQWVSWCHALDVKEWHINRIKEA